MSGPDLSTGFGENHPHGSADSPQAPPPSLRRLMRAAIGLGGGAAIGHAVTIAAMPLVAVLYGPEAVGAWGAWLALAGIIGVVACCRYDTAIALPASDREAIHVALLAVLLAVLVCGLTAILVPIILLAGIPGPWHTQGVALGWVPLGALVLAWVMVATQWLARVHAVSSLAAAKIWCGAVTAGLHLVLGLLGAGALGLIAGDVGGRCAGLWGRTRQAWRDHAAEIAHTQPSDLWNAARRHRVHALWMTPTTLIDGIGQQVPLLCILSFYGDAVGGQFALAQRMMALPAALLGQSIAQFFLPMMARAHRHADGSAIRLFLGLSGVLAGCGVAVLTAMSLVTADRISFVLGWEWRDMMVFVTPLAVLTAAALVASTVSQTAIVLGGQRWYAMWVTLRLLAVATGMWLGDQWDGVHGAVWGMCVAGCVSYGVLWGVMVWGLANSSAGQAKPCT